MPKLAMHGAPETACPDIGAVVSAAQEEMARLIKRGELQNDPLRHPIEALAVHLATQHALMRDLTTRMQAVQHPITVEEIQTLNRAASKHAVGEVVYAVKALTQQNYWKLSVIGAAVLLAYGLACGGGGFAAGSRWTSDRDQAKLDAVDHIMIEAKDGLPAMVAADRALWLEIIAANPNARDLYRGCQPLPQRHGSACALPIWTRRPADGETPAAH